MPIRTNQPQRTRILVVDDQHDLADMLSHALTDQGYDVTTCNNGREALQIIKTLRPAAVLLDVMMPETDGFAVLRELRNDPNGQQLPVILMSAAWRSQEKQRHIGTTLSMAPTLVLPKPFELAELDRCLHQLGVSA
jgi:CheY-like chemotaxis protein